jgi:hypothetical protein
MWTRMIDCALGIMAPTGRIRCRHLRGCADIEYRPAMDKPRRGSEPMGGIMCLNLN